MSDTTPTAARLAALESRLDTLEARLAEATEAGRSTSSPAERTTPGKRADGDEDVFWALHELQKRLPEDGGVLFTGSVALPDGPVDWQEARLTGQLLEQDWAEYAGALAALGHPVRLLLLREVLNGRHAVSELGDDERFGTSGQVYHHLRQLVAAGWLRSTGRGTYAVPPQRVIPLLVIIFGADR